MNFMVDHSIIFLLLLKNVVAVKEPHLFEGVAQRIVIPTCYNIIIILHGVYQL